MSTHSAQKYKEISREKKLKKLQKIFITIKNWNYFYETGKVGIPSLKYFRTTSAVNVNEPQETISAEIYLGHSSG